MNHEAMKRLALVVAVIVFYAFLGLAAYSIVTDDSPHCTVDPFYGDTCQ